MFLHCFYMFFYIVFTLFLTLGHPSVVAFAARRRRLEGRLPHGGGDYLFINILLFIICLFIYNFFNT